jgi:hypothetical protein
MRSWLWRALNHAQDATMHALIGSSIIYNVAWEDPRIDCEVRPRSPATTAALAAPLRPRAASAASAAHAATGAAASAPAAAPLPSRSC